MKTPHRVNWPVGYEPPQASLTYLNLTERSEADDLLAVVYAEDPDGFWWHWRVPAHVFGQLFYDLDKLFVDGMMALREVRSLILQHAFQNWRDLDWEPGGPRV